MSDDSSRNECIEELQNLNEYILATSLSFQVLTNLVKQSKSLNFNLPSKKTELDSVIGDLSDQFIKGENRESSKAVKQENFQNRVQQMGSSFSK